MMCLLIKSCEGELGIAEMGLAQKHQHKKGTENPLPPYRVRLFLLYTKNEPFRQFDEAFDGRSSTEKREPCLTGGGFTPKSAEIHVTHKGKRAKNCSYAV